MLLLIGHFFNRELIRSLPTGHPDMHGLTDGSVITPAGGEESNETTKISVSILSILGCNIQCLSFKEGEHLSRSAPPAPNKDRWSVPKTDGWVLGLQQIGVRRALNQGMAQLKCSRPTIIPTTPRPITT